jgi:outer membrane protein OmpA-like peptidoglycan-associated protein
MLLSLTGCSYNPFAPDNHTTGTATGAAVGAGIGVGGVALLNGPKYAMGLAGLGGGMLGYYVTTLRYDAGGVMQAGGQVYTVGRFVAIYIPTDSLFDVNTSELLPQATPILDSVVAILARYPDNNILISGNTSGFGRAKREQRLSLARAKEVSAYLWNQGINDFKLPGIDMRKLNYVGYGDYFPISSSTNHTNEGIRENSRIQITSYPSNVDLQLDRRHMTVNNIGALSDNSDRIPVEKRSSGCGSVGSIDDCFKD